MSTPQAVAQGLRQTAQQLVTATDETIAQAARFAVSEADRVGGTMRDGTRLTATETSTADGSTVQGVPAGGWALKTYGRRGGYRIGGRLLDLRDAGGAVPGAAWAVNIDRATHGDGRWDRVIDATAEEAADRFQANVTAATDG